MHEPTDDERQPAPPPASAAAPGDGGWQRVVGWGAVAALVSALLAAAANLTEVLSWFAPDETRELVAETRGVVVDADSKIEELLTLLRVQAAASGTDLNVEAEAALRNAIAAIVASGNVQKQSAVALLDAGDVAGAAELMARTAAGQTGAVGQTAAAAAASWREAGALFYGYDTARAIDSYKQAAKLEPGDPETLEMLGYALNRAGRLDEAERVFGEALALDLPPQVRASVLIGLGGIAKQRGRYPQAGEHLAEALTVAERARLPAARIHALVAQATLDMSMGRPEEADRRLSRAQSLAAEYDDESLRVRVLESRGTLAARRGDFDAAEQLLGDALAVHDSLKDRAGRARALGNLGAVALIRGDVDAAETMLLETVAIGESLGWQSSVAYDLVNLAAISATRGDFAQADERLGRAQAIAAEVGLAELEPVIVFNRGEMARDAGDLESACRHWLAALPRLRDMGSEHTATAEEQLAAAGCPAPPEDSSD